MVIFALKGKRDYDDDYSFFDTSVNKQYQLSNSSCSEVNLGMLYVKVGNDNSLEAGCS